MCQLSWNLWASTSWNPQALSRPVMGLLYLYSIQSPPATGKVCDITYFIGTNPLRRWRWHSLQTQGDITKEWVLVLFCLQSFSYGIGMNDLIMYLCNESIWQNVKAFPQSLPIPHITVTMYLLTSTQSPPTTLQFVVCALPWMTWHILWYSACHKQLNLGTTVHNTKGVPCHHLHSTCSTSGHWQNCHQQVQINL
jgi:hypothetical protein